MRHAGIPRAIPASINPVCLSLMVSARTILEMPVHEVNPKIMTTLFSLPAAIAERATISMIRGDAVNSSLMRVIIASTGTMMGERKNGILDKRCLRAMPIAMLTKINRNKRRICMPRANSFCCEAICMYEMLIAR